LTHNIAIKRYYNKKIISSSKCCNDISKYYDFLYIFYYPLTKINIFNSHDEKTFVEKYLFITILREKI